MGGKNKRTNFRISKILKAEIKNVWLENFNIFYCCIIFRSFENSTRLNKIGIEEKSDVGRQFIHVYLKIATRSDRSGASQTSYRHTNTRSRYIHTVVESIEVTSCLKRLYSGNLNETLKTLRNSPVQQNQNNKNDILLF